MSPFFTREGDDGYTGLLGKGRVVKSDSRIELLGTLDEANAALGVARAWAMADQSKLILLQAQRYLYLVMAETAATPENTSLFSHIDIQHVTWAEKTIDTLTGMITMPDQFIIPGDTPAEAGIDMARTMVRRAERRVSEMVQMGQISNENIPAFLNRLSSLCFVLELVENQRAGRSTPTLAKG